MSEINSVASSRVILICSGDRSPHVSGMLRTSDPELRDESKEEGRSEEAGSLVTSLARHCSARAAAGEVGGSHDIASCVIAYEPTKKDTYVQARSRIYYGMYRETDARSHKFTRFGESALTRARQQCKEASRELSTPSC